MGKVIMSGIVPPLVAPISGILASDLAVGSSVYLMENGVAAEYLVVNQGIPSSMYDASCNGTWLLRKDIYEERAFNTTEDSWYASSSIHSYLNDTFIKIFDASIQSLIKQVKIPHGTGNSEYVGSNGLSTKVFLLGGYEVGFTNSELVGLIKSDSAKLSYFSTGAGSYANNKRIAYLNGTAKRWFTRSYWADGTETVIGVQTSGTYVARNSTSSDGIRPALILPHTALFDKTTLILKGVK